MLACFFGGLDTTTRDALRARGIAVHPTPQRLARAFTRLVDYRLGRELLMQTPQGLPARIPAAIEAVQAYAGTALAEDGRALLSGEAAARLLEPFALPVKTEDGPSANDTIVDIAVELHDDPEFGPVFRLAAPPVDGISAPFVFYGLPPLNPMLAREVLSRSPYAHRVPIDPVLSVLTALSEAVCVIEQIAGFTASLRIKPACVELLSPQIRLASKRGRLAIVPYPRRLEQTIEWRGAQLTIRPIRPEDEQAHSALVAAMSPEDLRMRFFGAVRGFDHSQLARMTQIDYDREMALIATAADANGAVETLGVVRAVADPDNESAEFAVAVRSDMKGKGLGRLLMERIIEYVRGRGTRFITGDILRENAPMLALARAKGFEMRASEDPAVISVRLALQ
jgi:acetyltransferase